MKNSTSQQKPFNLTLAVAAGFVLPLAGFSPGAQAQTIIQNFAGLSITELGPLNGFRYAPPDTMGAAGPNNFVQFINGGYEVFDKTGGRASTATTDTAFWNAAGISSTLTGQGLSDTRVLYDPNSSRWFASEITFGTVSGVGNVNNSVLLAVSKTANPLDGWLGTSYTAVSATGFGDYPTLAVDSNGVYIGTNNFNASNAYTGITTTSIPKSSLLTATPTTTGRVTSTQASSNPSRGDTPQGVTNTGAATTNGAFLAVAATGYNALKLTTVNTPAGTATFGTPLTITTTYDGDTTQVRQPDGTRAVDGLDHRLSSSVVQVGNRIFTVNAINNGNLTGNLTAAGFDSVHWMVLNASTGAVVAEGLINDATHDFFQPSIAANPSGDIVIGYNRAGSIGTNDRISSYASVGHIDGLNNVTFGSPILLKLGGVSNYTDGSGTVPSRWGDYSATTLDPSDPTKFWTVQEVPLANGDWGTQISELQIVPEPSTVALTVLGTAGVALAAIRRRRPASQA